MAESTHSSLLTTKVARSSIMNISQLFLTFVILFIVAKAQSDGLHQSNDASVAEKVIYASPNATRHAKSCGTLIEPCSLQSAADLLSSLTSTPPAVLRLLETDNNDDQVFLVDEPISFHYSNKLSIVANNPSRSITIKAADLYGTLKFAAPELVFSDLVVTSFRNGAIEIKEVTQSATFERCRLVQNSAYSFVGSALTFRGQNLFFHDCVIEENEGLAGPTSDAAGGAVLFVVSRNSDDAHSALFLNCTISNNSISALYAVSNVAGGAIAFIRGSTPNILDKNLNVSIVIQDCVIEDNFVGMKTDPDPHSSLLSGGAISVSLEDFTVRMLISHCYVARNIIRSINEVATVAGGAVFFMSRSVNSKFTIVDSVISNNTASAGKAIASISQTGLCFGGAISIESTALVNITASNFTRNHCLGGQEGTSGAQSHGGALSISYPPRTEFGKRFWGNRIAISLSKFVRNSVLHHSSAGYGQFVATGGAIHIDLDTNRRIESVSINDCEFAENHVSSESSGTGGAVFIQGLKSSFSKPISIMRNVFIENYVESLSNAVATETQSLQGGAMALKLPSLGALEVNFDFNLFEGNNVRSLVSPTSAGALYVEISTAKGNNTVATQFEMRRSTFSQNWVRGPHASGAALSILGLPNATIWDSEWTGNELKCSQPGDGSGGPPCQGGAVYVFFRTSIAGDSIYDRANVDFWRCNFSNNGIENSQCSDVSGGALYADSSSVFASNKYLSFHVCNFNSNIVTGGRASGGALSIAGPIIDVLGCNFTRNFILGNGVQGGAIFMMLSSKLNVSSSSFHSNSVSSFRSPICQSYSQGGTFSLGGNTMQTAKLVNSTIRFSEARRGGAIFISAIPGLEYPFEFSNLTIADSHSADAGGAMFVDSVCATEEPYYGSLCRSISNSALNVTAGKYGNLCASTPVSFHWADKYHTLHDKRVRVAPGQGIRLSFTFKDLFGNVPFAMEDYVEAALWHSSEPAKLLTRTPQDQAHVGSDRVMTFDELSISSRPGNDVSINFTGHTMQHLCQNSYFSLQLDFSIASCLPGYFHLDNETTCELCPPHSYTLDGSRSVCTDCAEHEADEDSESESSYSCLTIASNYSTSEGKANSQWQLKVSPGFYPVPSLTEPEELEVCPNHACLPIFCEPRAEQHSLKWSLNCSACPILPDEEEEEGNINPRDCHCKIGHEGRLCSRCSCDLSEGDCYFASGEVEDRTCTKCQKVSVAVVVTALSALQISLVVFLLFHKSALALLLAEVAIVIVLVLAGVGESWMLNLVIIMGLLFVATSLSRRVAKHSEIHGESEGDGIVLQDERERSIKDQELHNEHNHGHQEANVVGITKIIIFFLQSAASIIQDSAWPPWISQAMKRLEVVNLRVSGVECFAPSTLSDPTAKLLFQLLMPMFLAINLVIAALISAAIVRIDLMSRLKSLRIWCMSKRSKTSSRSTDHLESDSEDSIHGSDGHEDDSERSSLLLQRSRSAQQSWSARDLVSRLQFSIFFLLSASYFELSSSVLEMLRPCSKFGFMHVYPWVQCSLSDRTYLSLLSIAISFFVIYSVGTPAFFGVVLLRNRNRIRAGDHDLESKYGFLYESYKLKYFWFDLVWFLRRIMLASAISLLAAPPGYQIALIFLILQGSLILHRSWKPFASNLANAMDQLATATLLFGVVMGFVLHTFQEVESYHPHIFVLQNVVWLCVAIAALVMVIALVGPSFRIMVLSWRQKLRKE